ncbi:MAG: hypothetical protein ACHQIM_21840 [Sphingobacteriales bacterium]
MIKKINDPQIFKLQALQWAAACNVFCYLDSNNFVDQYSKFDCLIAAGVKDDLVAASGKAFDELDTFRKKNPGWMPGFFGYDLKNETENLSSLNADNLHFPDLYFFVPQYLILIKGNEIEILADDPQQVFDQIQNQPDIRSGGQPALKIQSRLSKAEYLATIAKVKEHISRGDIYVTNYCQEFFAENAAINPLAVFF